MTSDQIEQEFRAKLMALLQEYNATLTAEDHWSGYAECGQDVRMTVEVPSIYDPESHDCIREMTFIDLGRWVDGTL